MAFKVTGKKKSRICQQAISLSRADKSHKKSKITFLFFSSRWRSFVRDWPKLLSSRVVRCAKNQHLRCANKRKTSRHTNILSSRFVIDSNLRGARRSDEIPKATSQQWISLHNQNWFAARVVKFREFTVDLRLEIYKQHFFSSRNWSRRKKANQERKKF